VPCAMRHAPCQHQHMHMNHARKTGRGARIGSFKNEKRETRNDMSRLSALAYPNDSPIHGLTDIPLNTGYWSVGCGMGLNGNEPCGWVVVVALMPKKTARQQTEARRLEDRRRKTEVESRAPEGRASPNWCHRWACGGEAAGHGGRCCPLSAAARGPRGVGGSEGLGHLCSRGLLLPQPQLAARH
jgi:hypothetical protein